MIISSLVIIDGINHVIYIIYRASLFFDLGSLFFYLTSFFRPWIPFFDLGSLFLDLDLLFLNLGMFLFNFGLLSHTCLEPCAILHFFSVCVILECVECGGRHVECRVCIWRAECV